MHPTSILQPLQYYCSFSRLSVVYKECHCDLKVVWIMITHHSNVSPPFEKAQELPVLNRRFGFCFFYLCMRPSCINCGSLFDHHWGICHTPHDFRGRTVLKQLLQHFKYEKLKKKIRLKEKKKKIQVEIICIADWTRTRCKSNRQVDLWALTAV